jgi:hypothetical protein
MQKTMQSSTQVASVESIRIIGESIGVSNLSEEACREIISDLTFTIKSIIIVNLVESLEKIRLESKQSFCNSTKGCAKVCTQQQTEKAFDLGY